VTLLSGFLGSGKTTLLNRILSEQHGTRFAVIVNEFGDVGIDGRLVVGSDEEVIELNNGCVCCTVSGDLADTIANLMDRRQRKLIGKLEFDRIIIEASGMASPGPIAQTFEIVPALAEQVVLDGIVTLLRADSIRIELEQFTEAAEQIGYADRLVLNACDLVEEAELDKIEVVIHALNSFAPIRRATRADVPLDELLAVGARDAGHFDTLKAIYSSHSDHLERVGTVALRTSALIDIHRLKMWLQFIAKDRSHELLRLKGIFNCEGFDRAVVVQGVYQWLELGPGEGTPPAESILVIIGRDLNVDQIERGWAAVSSGN
jgi:G3E family GTPase